MRSEPARPALLAAHAALLVVDLQERLMPAMEPALAARLQRNVGVWLEAAPLLGLPIVVSEQYPKGLGATVDWVRARLPAEVTPLAKVRFDALGDDAIRAAVAATGRTQLVVVGVETHVCVLQTARSAAARGSAWVVADACASRTAENHAFGLAQAARVGAEVVSTELALFELLGGADHPAFRAVSRAVK